MWEAWPWVTRGQLDFAFSHAFGRRRTKVYPACGARRFWLQTEKAPAGGGIEFANLWNPSLPSGGQRFVQFCKKEG